MVPCRTGIAGKMKPMKFNEFNDNNPVPAELWSNRGQLLIRNQSHDTVPLQAAVPKK